MLIYSLKQFPPYASYKDKKFKIKNQSKSLKGEITLMGGSYSLPYTSELLQVVNVYFKGDVS